MERKIATQDVSWYLDINDKSQLDLNPPYQRRSVWSINDKRYFIDTILNNYPAPPLFLHKTISENGKVTYHVVDGKQRLQTIIDFAKDLIRVPDDFSDSDLRKKVFSEFSKDWKQQFWNYSLITEMLPDVGQEALKSIFDRINRNSRKLTPQELRHARYDGWLISAVEAEAATQEWKTFKISTEAKEKRMLDVQFVTELFAVIIEQRISGFDQDHLDQLYADYDNLTENPDFPSDEVIQTFERIKQLIVSLLTEQPKLAKWLKVQSHFYSLWSYLTLAGQGTNGLAERYNVFLQAVSSYDESEGENAKPVSENLTFDKAVADYAANSKGASTDLKQRSIRLASLIEGLK